MNVLQFDESSLHFVISPRSGLTYSLTLTEFATGGSIDQVPARLRNAWIGDYRGRPILAQQIADFYRNERFEKSASYSVNHALRSLYRALDEIEADSKIEINSLIDITDAHGLMLFERTGGTRTHMYKHIKGLLAKMRSLHRLPPLFWPARRHDHLADAELIDDKAVAALFKAIKEKARHVKTMFNQGCQLASQGRDPRTDSRSSEGWHSRENRAWLITEVTRERLLEKCELKAIDAYFGFTGDKRKGPDFIAPEMTERGREGVVGALRWVHPSLADTALFLLLFIIGTGWNLSTALALDISGDEKWFYDHPYHPEFAMLHAFKSRAGRDQDLPVKKEPEWHPYQIVRYMIFKTKSLRATLEHKLQLATARYETEPTALNRGTMQKLQNSIRSPWLYHNVNKIGDVSAFQLNDQHMNRIIRSIGNEGDLFEQHPALKSFTVSTSRDAWINHVYQDTGFQAFITQLAGQHADLSTTSAYLKPYRYRAFSEGQIRKVMDAAFADISSGGKVDPTRIALLVANGTITPEQERRLSDYRYRTRLGVGCLDPENPPAHIAPNHQPGALCGIQRCTGCHHGVVFTDSMPALARAYAELLFIHKTIPYVSWHGSSFDDELTSIEATLTLFDASEVQSHVAAWTSKLNRGEVRAHDTYPGK